jgi:membrane-associated phospholipid phosphatase
MNFLRSISFTSLLLIILFNASFSQISTDDPFDVKTDKELVITGIGALIGTAAIIINTNNTPLTLKEISSLNSQDVNKFDRIALGPYKGDVPGDIMLYGSFIFPLTFLTYDKTLEDFGTISLMYGEAVLLNASINSLVKAITLRDRPFVYDENSLLEPKLDIDARYSFFSGHTSMTAVNTFFTARVYSGYISNQTTKTILWTAAAIIPAIAGYSRINTHNHFPTDVIVGYIVGAAIGYLIPEIHKTKNSKSNNSSTMPEQFIHKPVFGFQITF